MSYENQFNQNLKDLTVAFDIGRKQNSVAFVNQTGKVLHRYKKVPNNLPGLERVWKQTQALRSQYGLSTVVFGMESSGPYWFGPYWELQKRCSACDPEKFSVEALNPQIVSGFKGKFPYKKQKNDAKDAVSINRRIRFGEYEPSYVPNGNLLTLRYYTRHRFHLVKTMVAEKLRFLSLLFVKCSEYKKMVDKKKTFSDVFGQCSTAIITKYPTCDDLANASTDELVSLVQTYDRNGSAILNIDKKINFLQMAAKESYPMPEELVEPVNFILSQTIENINFLKQQIKEVSEKINSQLETIDDPAKTIPGLGPVYAGGIIAETPDPKVYNYKNGQASLASYLGIISSMDDSGDHHSEFNKMTKTGNSYGRYYYIEGANSLIRHNNPVFKEYFERKIKETHKRQFKRTLGLTARKLIRIYYYLKVKNIPFKLPVNVEQSSCKNENV